MKAIEFQHNSNQWLLHLIEYTCVHNLYIWSKTDELVNLMDRLHYVLKTTTLKFVLLQFIITDQYNTILGQLISLI